MASVQTSAVAAGSRSQACPKCGKPLTDAAGLGWCPACGFCRTLEEAPSKAELKRDEAPAKQNTYGEPSGPAEPFRIPIWFLFLIVSMSALAAGSYSVGQALAPNSFPRALWTSVQIACGFLVLFIGQFIALVRIAPDDEKLSFKDAIVPFRVYGHVFKRLSSMGLSVYTLGCGLTLIVCAFFLIGGLGHWFTYLKNSKERSQATSTRR